MYVNSFGCFPSKISEKLLVLVSFLISNYYTLTLHINMFIEFYEYISKLSESSQAQANSKTCRKPFSYIKKGQMLAQNYKFSNKNSLLCSWRDFKKNLCGICTYDKRNFKPKISPIFHFYRVTEVRMRSFQVSMTIKIFSNKLDWKISLAPSFRAQSGVHCILISKTKHQKWKRWG